MKKFLKGIAVALALALVVTPCAILFAGCGAQEWTSNEYLKYVKISMDSYYITNADYEFVEEVKEGDAVVGKIYKKIDAEYHMAFSIDGDEAIFTSSETDGRGDLEQGYVQKFKGSYEKYARGYLLLINAGPDSDGETGYGVLYVEVDGDKIVGTLSSAYGSIENSLTGTELEEAKTAILSEAKEEIDTYIASEKSFVVYFGETNGGGK